MGTARDLAGRQRLYRALARRNRVVGALRVLVPAAGLALVATLLGRIALAGLADTFHIERIEIAPDAVTVTGPRLAGTLEDGARIAVAAGWARTRFDAPDLMELSAARLEIARPQGPAMTVTAEGALVETASGRVLVAGPALMTDASGTEARIERSAFDWPAQVLTSEGPVRIAYADGAVLEAGTLRYDAHEAVWTFGAVRLTLPDLPGADAPQGTEPR